LDGSALLEWQTASERNNSHFEIEHSVNGIEFTVDEPYVQGAGNSHLISEYAFLHNEVAQGDNYY
jgi:hypothetical protein